jgi:hypothetical protein
MMDDAENDAEKLFLFDRSAVHAATDVKLLDMLRDTPGVQSRSCEDQGGDPRVRAGRSTSHRGAPRRVQPQA